MRIGVVIIFTFLLLFPCLLMGQISSVEKNTLPDYLGVGIDVGFTGFYGDLDDGAAEGNAFNNYAIKAHVNKTFGPIFMVQGSITFGKCSGEKKRSGGFYNYFYTNFIEYTFNTGFNIVPLFYKKINHKLNVIANIGVGLIDFKTKRYDGNSDTLIKSLGYSGEKSTTELVIPLGAKVLYHIDGHSAVSIQTTFSRIDTDKMDALEGNNNSDYYNFTSIGYIYKFYPGNKNGNVSKNSIKRKKKKKKPKSVKNPSSK